MTTLSFRSSLTGDAGDDTQVIKFIQDRITLVETHFSNVCSAYGGYVRKTAKLRDRGDVVAKSLKDYAAADTLNRSLRSGLGQFADCLSAVEDYRQTMIDRLEVKVVGQLTPYDTTCKMARENVHATLRARRRQLERRKRVQKARDRAPLNRQEVAETELTKATVDASQTMRQLEELMDNFEKKKLGDIKNTMLDYVNIELLFHAKAIEIFSQAFNHIKAIDEEDDMQEFRNCLKMPSSGTSHLDLVRSIQGSRSGDVHQSSLPIPKQRSDLSTRGSSMQSLVGQLQQALRNRKDDEEEEEEEEEEHSESEVEEVESIESENKSSNRKRKLPKLKV